MSPIGSAGGLTSRLPHHLASGSALGGSGQISGGRVQLQILPSVMQLDPLLPQVGHALFCEPGIVQGPLHDPVPTHPPVGPPTPTRQMHLFQANTRQPSSRLQFTIPGFLGQQIRIDSEANASVPADLERTGSPEAECSPQRPGDRRGRRALRRLFHDRGGVAS